MKSCPCCGAQCAPDAPHCPACGEASFGELSTLVPSRDPAPSADPVADTDPPKRGPGRPRREPPN